MSTTLLMLLSLPVLALWLAPVLAIAFCLSFGPCARRIARLRAWLLGSREAAGPTSH